MSIDVPYTIDGVFNVFKTSKFNVSLVKAFSRVLNEKSIALPVDKPKFKRREIAEIKATLQGCRLLDK